jgi:hypothetical protein
MKELSRDELELALDNGGKLFERIRSELEEGGSAVYRPGPWYAGMEPFPA